jgi:hypothetical protein
MSLKIGFMNKCRKSPSLVALVRFCCQAGVLWMKNKKMQNKGVDVDKMLIRC